MHPWKDCQGTGPQQGMLSVSLINTHVNPCSSYLASVYTQQASFEPSILIPAVLTMGMLLNTYNLQLLSGSIRLPNQLALITKKPASICMAGAAAGRCAGTGGHTCKACTVLGFGEEPAVACTGEREGNIASGCQDGAASGDARVAAAVRGGAEHGHGAAALAPGSRPRARAASAFPGRS